MNPLHTQARILPLLSVVTFNLSRAFFKILTAQLMSALIIFREEVLNKPLLIFYS